MGIFIQVDIYKSIEIILFCLFEALIIYDLFRIIRFKRYFIMWIPVIVDIILFILNFILLNTIFNMPNDYNTIKFAKIYLVSGKVQLSILIFIFIRIVFIEKLKRK